MALDWQADGGAGEEPDGQGVGAAGLGGLLARGQRLAGRGCLRLGQMGVGRLEAGDRAQTRGGAAHGGVDGVVGAGPVRAGGLAGVGGGAGLGVITALASERAGLQPRRIWSAMKAAARQSLSASAISSTHHAICSSWRSRSSSGNSAISARAASSSWKSGWARRASISRSVTASTRASLAGDIPPARR